MESPSLSQWAGTGSGMNAVVVLDQSSEGTHGLARYYTNLDEIRGKVVVRSNKSADIDKIVVKLEGESRTRLLSPMGPNGEKPRPQLEHHKILYRTQTVFPPTHVLEGRSEGVSKAAFTLSAGTHEYPFSFKIPFNNACTTSKGPMPQMSVSGSGFELAHPPSRHVKKTLPPTLSGFPGEAEIRYFVKATVTRRAFWKENPRGNTPFNLFPIEPPRPPVSGTEMYARQRHVFTPTYQESSTEKSKMKMKSLFGGKAKEGSSPVMGNESPSVSVDARLPEPSILTCNADVPLRIIVKKLNGSHEIIKMESLQISLIGNTKIRAHDVHRTENSSWIILSKSNMNYQVGTPSDPVNTETIINDSLWRGQLLPNDVAPTFETCNISREYQLDMRIGLSWGSGLKAQSVVLPMRLDVEIYSGVVPPKEVIDAMAEARAHPEKKPFPTASTAATDEKLRTEGRTESSVAGPSVASEHDTGSLGAPKLPARAGSVPVPPAAADQEEAPPPSYEDAIAGDMPSVNPQQRPEYAPPPAAEDQLLGMDEKKTLGRRAS